MAVPSSCRPIVVLTAYACADGGFWYSVSGVLALLDELIRDRVLLAILFALLTGMVALVLHRVLQARRPRSRRRVTFRTVPEELAPPGNSSALRHRVGVARAFGLDPHGGRLPKSWVLLDCEMTVDDGLREPVLQIDEGHGFENGKGICLPRPRRGRTRTVVLLPNAVQGLRLGLGGWTGDFRLGKVSMREISKLELGIRSVSRLVLAAVRQPWRLPGLARRAVALGRTAGVQELKNLLAGTDRQLDEYGRWIERFDSLDAGDVARIRERIQRLVHRPRISILMPVYNAPERWLRRAIDSVECQLYPDWQLCLADDASTEAHVRRVLEEYAARDSRIAVVFRERNGHIAEASNSALAVATGEFVALLDHDDELPPHALYLVAEEINECPDVDLIYSDEDKIDEGGRRYEAYFKPDWDPDLFGSQNIFSHLGVYRTALVRKIGGFRTGLDGSQDYDLALRCMRETQPALIRHIPYVLYHWRATPTSTASGGSAKRYAFIAARQALREHFARDDTRTAVSFGPFLALYRVRYPLPQPRPLVSLIVSARGVSETLHRDLTSLMLRTDYPAIELLVAVDDVRHPAMLEVLRQLDASGLARVVRYEEHLDHSALVNRAAREAHGTILALLDSTLQPVNPDWLAEMVSHCVRSEIGAVGAKLLSSDGTIWNAGMVLGLGELAEYPYRGFPAGAHGYFGRAQSIQRYSAVSGECLIVRREIFEQVGGFDEENLPACWSDVDFCLRVQEAGYGNLWTPYAELRRLRGHDPSARVTPSRERTASEYLRRRWGAMLAADAHHSPNLSLHDGHHFLAWPPRRRRPWTEEPRAASARGALPTERFRQADDSARRPDDSSLPKAAAF